MNFFAARLSDAPMTDLMVDIETTGTDPERTAMIQLAAIPFNYETSDIGTPFNRCLDMPLNRYWSESTKRWWYESSEKRDVLQGIVSKAEDPFVVINDFVDFVRALDRPVRFWSRGQFDWSFVQSYCDQYGLAMPFSYSAHRDLRSFQAGLRGTVDEPDMRWLTMPGAAHNALFDCVIQLKRLFSARDGIFYEILPAEENAA